MVRFSWFLAGWFLLHGAQVFGEEDSRSPWTIELKAGGEKVTSRWLQEKEAWILDISDRRGIGSLTLKASRAVKNETLVIRLHLKGLEELRLTAGDQTLSYSVASTGTNSHRCDRKDKPVSADDPYRIKVKVMGKARANPANPANPPNERAGSSVIPLRPDQWFEFQLPAKWLENREIGFRWIDFFRG